MRARTGLIVGVGVAAAAAVALADDTGPLDEHVPHQDLPPPAAAAEAPDGPSVVGDEPATGRNPAAFSHGDKLLPGPEPDQPQSDQEPVLGRGGFAADRDTESRPDYHTGPDSTLHYVTVFNPSVLPFKRMSAMDSVAADYTLHVGSTARRDIDVGGQRSQDRDLFWGSVVVALQPGVDVPLPSVAPDMRVLSYEVEPHTNLTFSVDGADNYFVRSDESGVSGDFRLIFLADAPSRYFAPAVPSGYRVRDVARLADPSMIPDLPSGVQSSAERALRQLGVTRNMPLDEAVDELTYYFRGFEAKASPRSSGNVFWDLFVSQAGVCRHRSFTFTVAANALGIPTRYVTNEAHAFVEIWVPEHEWLRVDLGGAALRMEVQNAGAKSIHRPREPDQLAKPPAYGEDYTRLEGDVSGLSGDQLAEGQQATADGDDPEPSAADGAGGGDGNGDGSGDGNGDGNGDETGDGDDPDEPSVGPGKTLPQLPPDSVAGKTPTEITVTEADPVGFRGETIRVRGTLATTSGQPVGDLRIDVYLAPAGHGGDGAVVVGHTVTDDDGRFAAEADLPRNLELRDYEVYAATPGDASHAPSVSN